MSLHIPRVVILSFALLIILLLGEPGVSVTTLELHNLSPHYQLTPPPTLNSTSTPSFGMTFPPMPCTSYSSPKHTGRYMIQNLYRHYYHRFQYVSVYCIDEKDLVTLIFAVLRVFLAHLTGSRGLCQIYQSELIDCLEYT